MPQLDWHALIGLLLLLTPLHAESLTYNLIWPSGLSLGEARLTQNGSLATFDLDASLPAFGIHDHYTSSSNAAGCTVEFTRETAHGGKKANERIRVASDGRITRETVNGGKTELPFQSCPRDSLALLSYARQSKLPAPQTVLFGSGYPVRFESGGPQTITVSERPTETEKVICILTLPKIGDYRLEIYFARNASRTPVLIRAPFPLGTFAMELVR
ncbi:MAG: DUF3108 domain-containing protein [Acidobacteriota bacterium]|nr:DUF3108 domain-containing protein [Acidobacteriota bacterium]